MRIANAAVSLGSTHVSLQTHEVKESLRAWVGSRRPNFEANGQALSQNAPFRSWPDPAPHSGRVDISDTGKSKQSGETDAIEDSLQAIENDPILRLIREIIARLTGREVRIFDAKELQVDNPVPPPHSPAQTNPTEQAPTAGYGIEYDRHESYSESEQTTFKASGSVVTGDGRKIAFNLSLSMPRRYDETTDVSLRLGDARRKQDPLVINFDSNAARLTDQRFAFDLDADGRSENINFLAGGSGFLAIDRNADGKIDDGSELFGPRSGDGFAELAALDSDNNGWIDENDPAYAQLLVWFRDGAGNDRLASLNQTDVGAIGLTCMNTPFDLKDAGNELQGQIRATGIFLTEEGRAGSVQQVDLTA